MMAFSKRQEVELNVAEVKMMRLLLEGTGMDGIRHNQIN